jgi:hypothetical protein
VTADVGPRGPLGGETLRISRADLAAAAEAGVIAPIGIDPLWRFLASSRGAESVADAGAASAPDAAPRFDVVHLLWYAGALIVIGAMGLFSTEAWQLLGDEALLATAIVYAAVFVVAGAHLWHRRGLRVPGGLLVTCAVAMAPLATFAAQHVLGWWAPGDAAKYRDFFAWIKASWIPMDVATILAAAIALRHFRFAFLVMPAAVALWFMSMDLAPWLLGERWWQWEQRKWLSLAFGFAVILLAWRVDLLDGGADLGFWLHLFGGLTFWGALTAMDSGSELGKAAYCAINVALLFFGLFLDRRVYAVFGAIGIAFYLGHLSYKVFKDSLLFPFALSFIGMGLIGAGLLFYRHRSGIEAWVERRIPRALRTLRPLAVRHAR